MFAYLLKGDIYDQLYNFFQVFAFDIWSKFIYAVKNSFLSEMYQVLFKCLYLYKQRQVLGKFIKCSLM